jgi:alanine racemase
VGQHPGFTVIPVLKGNAYGHGIEQVAKILNDADCSFLAVDGYFEAARIRDITRHKILVMGYILPKNVPLLDVRRCSFVVQDIAGLHAFGALGKPVRIHVELNTGMNRLGLQENELLPYLAVLKQYPKLILEGVMSHLADADNELDDGYTARQVQTFDTLVERIVADGFSPTYIHIAQTAGSAKARSSRANSIRLGIGTYGINPLLSGDTHAPHLADLQPVLTLKSTLIKVLDLRKGDAVSYNGIFVAPKAMKVGVLPLGYYEGVPRALSNVGCVTYKGHVLPIVGRVCMNHTMVDLQGTELAVGDVVTVISNDPSQPNSVAKLQSEHSLFSYGTLTGFSSSVRRNIV